MKRTITFGLLTVEVTILVADLNNSDNNRFRIESVTNEHGARTGMSDDMMDSFEVYLEAMLPALINDREVRTVRVHHKGASSAIDTAEDTDAAASRIMDQFGWAPEDCEVVEEEAGFVAAVKKYNEAVKTLTETDYSAEFASNAEWQAHRMGDEIACLPPKDYAPTIDKKHANRTPRMQHDSWMDAEIGLTLLTMGIWL